MIKKLHWLLEGFSASRYNRVHGVRNMLWRLFPLQWIRKQASRPQMGHGMIQLKACASGAQS